MKLSIQQWRERYDLSQSELARRTGLCRATINRLERGNRNASLETAELIVAAIEEKKEEDITRALAVVRNAGYVVLERA